MFSNTFRGYIVISRKLHLSTCIPIIRDKIVNQIFTYSKQKHPFNYCALITRKYSHVNRSQEVALEYAERDKKKLEELIANPENLLIYEKLQLEVESYRYMNGRVPSELRATDWLMIFAATSKSQRRSYLEYRWKIEQVKKEAKEMRNIQADIEEPRPIIDPSDGIHYGLHMNTMFIRISSIAMNNFYNGRLMNAMMYEPKLVYDLGYDENMTAYEAQNCAKQLLLSFAINRSHKSPFNLYFCNANKSGIVMKQVHKSIPVLYDDSFPLNVTEKSYLDIFDKDKIVYLTPDANTVLEKFDSEMIYVIGAMVDKIQPQRVSLAKARKEKIKMVRLPLAEHLPWGTGSAKNLPINQVLGILLDLHHTKDWNIALKHIPRRKLKPSRLHNMHKQVTKKQELLDMLMNRK